jgi:hypothetical protein
MNAKTIPIFPADLESIRRRFEQWRQTCRARTRIPDSLWSAAVKMAERYGTCRTAKALRLGYYSLKERVEREAAVNKATFLELPLPSPTVAGECLLEWEDTAGAKMRVHLKGVAVPDLVALSRSFWEGHQR